MREREREEECIGGGGKIQVEGEKEFYCGAMMVLNQARRLIWELTTVVRGVGLPTSLVQPVGKGG